MIHFGHVGEAGGAAHWPDMLRGSAGAEMHRTKEDLMPNTSPRRRRLVGAVLAALLPAAFLPLLAASPAAAVDPNPARFLTLFASAVHDFQHLTAQVKAADGRTGVPGVMVTFTTSGAGGLTSPDQDPSQETTDANGFASIQARIAPGGSGTQTVTATISSAQYPECLQSYGAGLNATGTTAAGNCTASVTLIWTNDPPTAVPVLALTAVPGDGSALVAWQTPATSTGAVPVSYDVYADVPGGGPPPVAILPSGAVSHRLSNLINDVTHFVTVRAHFPSGNSSLTSVPVTPTANAAPLPDSLASYAVDSDGGTFTPAAVGPVQTSIAVPGGLIGPPIITVSSTTAADDGTGGVTLLGQTFVITGPVATAAAPYVMTFTLDAAALTGIDLADVQVFRAGVALPACADGTPPPCIVDRQALTGGGATITVRTTQFSPWALGVVPDYEVSEPSKPFVGTKPPVFKAGSSVPVRFTLGRDWGLSVFAAGSPTVAYPSDADCGPGGPATGSLSYDPLSTVYTYAYKTNKADAGCPVELTLGFDDGDELTVHFSLR